MKTVSFLIIIAASLFTEPVHAVYVPEPVYAVYGRLSKTIYGSIDQRIVGERITNCSVCSRLRTRLRDFWDEGPRLYPAKDGIYLSEVDSYLRKRKENKLQADFYDGLLVHYTYTEPQPWGDKGFGLATQISELILDEVEIDGKRVAIEQINGVLIWNNRKYNMNTSLTMLDAELIYNRNATIPAEAEARLYGKIVGVFTDGYLVLQVDRAIVDNDQEKYWRYSPDKNEEALYAAPAPMFRVIPNRWPPPPPLEE